MSCPFHYAQIVSVFPAAVSSVITFMSPLKRLLFKLNNLVQPICPASSGFRDLAFRLLSKQTTTFLEIGNKTEEKGHVQRRNNFPLLPVLGLFEHCISQQDVTWTLSQAVISDDTKSASFFLCVIGQLVMLKYY